MVKSAPDGYTLMLGNVSTNAITPVLYAKKILDYAKSVTAVTNLIDVPAFMLASDGQRLPAQVGEGIHRLRQEEPGQGPLRLRRHRLLSAFRHRLFRQARRRPRLASAAEQERRVRRHPGLAARRRADGLPQRRVDRRQVQAGKLRALAVVNRTRLKDYPDVPTMQEAGFADVGTVAWNALFAPAATPKPVLEARSTRQ